MLISVKFVRTKDLLCFHCNAIKNKKANQSIQKVQNQRNERRDV